MRPALVRLLVPLTVLLAGAPALSGCGHTGGPTRGRLVDALVTSGLPRSQARCATGKLFAVLTADQRASLAQQGSGALDAKTSTALSQALTACRTPAPAPSGPPG